MDVRLRFTFYKALVSVLAWKLQKERKKVSLGRGEGSAADKPELGLEAEKQVFHVAYKIMVKRV